jgi:4-amino-4-deoxy-L-arabinose transferase-like glycosyltransferase
MNSSTWRGLISNLFTAEGVRLPGGEKWPVVRYLYLALGIGILLRIADYQVLGGGDDLGYLEISRALASGTYKFSGFTFNNRWGLVLPEAGLFWLFGFRYPLLVLYPLGLGLLQIYLAYRFVRLAGGKEAAGALAALVVATLPLSVRHSTLILSDLPSGVFGALSFYLVLRGRELAGRRRSLYFLLAGLSLGWSYECKEMAVITFPALAVFFLWDVAPAPRRVWPWVALGLGALLSPGLEGLYSYLASGDPLLRFHGVDESVHYYNSCCTSLPMMQEGRYFERFAVMMPDHIFTRFWEYSALFHLAVAGSVWAVSSRNTMLRLVTVWLWLSLLTLNFISSSLTDYIPVLIISRYFPPFVTPAAVLAAGFLHDLYRSLRDGEFSRPVFHGCLALLALTIGLSIYNPITFQFVLLILAIIVVVCQYHLRRGRTLPPNWRWAAWILAAWQVGLVLHVLVKPANPYRPFAKLDIQMLAVANQRRDLPVYTDTWSINYERFLDEYRDPKRFVDIYPLSLDQIQQGYVWRQDHYISEMRKNNNLVPPAFLLAPPPEWKIVFERSFKDEKYILYEVNPP